MSFQTTTKCPFCGAPLQTRSFEFCGKAYPLGFAICSCKQAQEQASLQEAQRNAEEQRAARRRAQRAYRKAGIKPRFLEPLPPELDEQAHSVLNTIQSGEGAYLFGGVGTGKSSVANWVAARFVDARAHVRVTDALGIVGAFYSTYSGAETEDELLSRLCECDVLVIDDIGKEVPQCRPISQIFRVINARYELMRPLLVTSQFSRNDLLKRLVQSGDVATAHAIVSRLHQMCVPFRFSGGDRRCA